MVIVLFLMLSKTLQQHRNLLYTGQDVSLIYTSTL